MSDGMNTSIDMKLNTSNERDEHDGQDEDEDEEYLQSYNFAGDVDNSEDDSLNSAGTREEVKYNQSDQEQPDEELIKPTPQNKKGTSLLNNVQAMYDINSSRTKMRLEQMKKRKNMLDTEDVNQFDCKEYQEDTHSFKSDLKKETMGTRLIYEEDEPKTVDQSNRSRSVLSESIEAYTEPEVIVSDLECEFEEDTKEAINLLNTNNKSFIPLTNTLVRSKRMLTNSDKATSSYLMALLDEPMPEPKQSRLKNYGIDEIIEEESENCSEIEPQSAEDPYQHLSNKSKSCDLTHKNSLSEAHPGYKKILTELTEMIKQKNQIEGEEKQIRMSEMKSNLIGKFSYLKSNSVHDFSELLKHKIKPTRRLVTSEDMTSRPKMIEFPQSTTEEVDFPDNESIVQIKDSEDINFEQELNNQLNENDLLNSHDREEIIPAQLKQLEITTPITFGIINTSHEQHKTFNTNIINNNINNIAISIIAHKERRMNKQNSNSITYDIRKDNKGKTLSGILTKAIEEHNNKRSKSSSKKTNLTDTKKKGHMTNNSMSGVKTNLNNKLHTNDLKQYLTYNKCENNIKDRNISLSSPNVSIPDTTTRTNRGEVEAGMKILRFPFSSLDHQHFAFDKLNKSKGKYFCLLIDKDFSGRKHEFKGLYEMNCERNIFTKLYSINNYQSTIELNEVKIFFKFNTQGVCFNSLPNEVRRLTPDIHAFHIKYKHKKG